MGGWGRMPLPGGEGTNASQTSVGLCEDDGGSGVVSCEGDVARNTAHGPKQTRQQVDKNAAATVGTNRPCRGCCDQLHCLSWQLDSPESETHLSSADGGLHGDSKEPTSWQALSIVHQSHP